MNILVTSPLPLPMDRVPMWNESIINYDSGLRQGSTTYADGLYRYSFNMSNYPRAKQSSLHAFYNQQKGAVTPFLMKDPYDYRTLRTVGSGLAIAANSGFYLTNSAGRRVVGDDTVMAITSALSGTLTKSTHWVSCSDNGFIKLVIGKATADTITCSADWFRKVAFTAYNEQSFLDQMFNGGFSVQEIPLA